MQTHKAFARSDSFPYFIKIWHGYFLEKWYFTKCQSQIILHTGRNQKWSFDAMPTMHFTYVITRIVLYTKFCNYSRQDYAKLHSPLKLGESRLLCHTITKKK